MTDDGRTNYYVDRYCEECGWTERMTNQDALEAPPGCPECGLGVCRVTPTVDVAAGPTPPWTVLPCAKCGVEGQATRTEGKPPGWVYVCESCEMYERGYDDGVKAVETVKGARAAEVHLDVTGLSLDERRAMSGLSPIFRDNVADLDHWLRQRMDDATRWKTVARDMAQEAREYRRHLKQVIEAHTTADAHNATQLARARHGHVIWYGKGIRARTLLRKALPLIKAKRNEVDQHGSGTTVQVSARVAELSELITKIIREVGDDEQ